MVSSFSLKNSSSRLVVKVTRPTELCCPGCLTVLCLRLFLAERAPRCPCGARLLLFLGVLIACPLSRVSQPHPLSQPLLFRVCAATRQRSANFQSSVQSTRR